MTPLAVNEPHRLPYSASLDGLRAIAVAMVVAYHLDAGWMPGGFLGVDLFFVISGFLITSLLLDEANDTGAIRLGRFWLRRFRRLAPPLIVMVAATVAAARRWAVPYQWSSIRGDAFGALGYFANWRFVVEDVGYFERLAAPSPLRHTWSLAVEEQWYLVWPLVMTVLCGALRGRRPARRAGTAVVAALAVASAAAMWAVMALTAAPGDVSRVYYGTDTRAQQLLVGAALAWAMSGQAAATWWRRMRRHAWPVNGALVVVVAVAVVVDDDARWIFHGGLLASSLVAAVVIAAAAEPGRDGPLGWLGAAPLVAIGKRSYGIYLWHWPVIIFVGPPIGLNAHPLLLAAVRLALTLVLADLSFRLVERPARAPEHPHRTVVGGWSLAGAATAALAVALFWGAIDIAPRAEAVNWDLPPAASAAPATTVATPTTAPSTAPPTTPSTTAPSTAPSTTAPSTTPVPEPAVRTLLVVGDSTAVALDDASPDQPLPGWQLITVARIGCSIAGQVIDVDADEAIVYDPACPDWPVRWEAWAEAIAPDLTIIMIGAWEVFDYVDDGVRTRFPGGGWTARLDAALRTALGTVAPHSGRVALMRLPCMEPDPRAVFAAAARADDERVAAFNARLEAATEQFPGVVTLPLDELLCPDGEPVVRRDGELIRYDGVHVAPAGAALVWDWLEPRLDELGLTTNDPASDPAP
ncbi:MAG TPA: acyltransferase family protein [Ilumatobacter sp.]